MKRVREKIARRKAILYEFVNENLTDNPDKTEENFKNQSQIEEELQQFETQEKELIKERKAHSYKITIKEMEEKTRYNKLDFEANSST